MGLLKDLGKTGMLGVAGLLATGKGKGLARAGMFGIGGLAMAGHAKRQQPQEAPLPGLAPMPTPDAFGGDVHAYLSAVQQWAHANSQAIASGTAGQPAQRQQMSAPQQRLGIAGAVGGPR